ncbi:MAG: hypothetical protein QM731_14005 [Chitinophagaceae bacterium]
MRPHVRIALTLFILYFGIKAIDQTYDPYYTGLFSEFQHIPFIILLVLTTVIIFLEYFYNRSKNIIAQYLVSIAGILFCLTVCIRMSENYLIDRAPTVLKVGNLSETSDPGRIFEFKANGKFRLEEYNMLGGTVYHGKYKRLNDTIKIINTSNISLPLVGVIKGDTIFWDGNKAMPIER